jgi:hypothetical protein
MLIRKRPNAKIWWSENDQKKMHDDQKMTKCNDMTFRKWSKVNVLWSEHDQRQTIGDQKAIKNIYSELETTKFNGMMLKIRAQAKFS